MISVPTTARAMPISPARTPRRAVFGWLSHVSDKMKSAAATRYEALPTQELAASSESRAGISPSKQMAECTLVTFVRLPAEHLEHAIGDPEAANDVDRGRDHAE